jgi:hypothetical protein
MPHSRFQLPVCVDPSNPQREDYVQAQACLVAVLHRDADASWDWCDTVGYEDCLVLTTTVPRSTLHTLCKRHGSPPMARWLAPPDQFRRPDADLYQLQRVLLGLQTEGKVRCCTEHACTLETLEQCEWIKPLTLAAPIRAQIRTWALQQTH